jgi:phosphate-selective porin
MNAFTNRLRRQGDRGASGVEYALVISLVLTGSTMSFEMMDERIEEHYQETAEDIGESDLEQFSPSTTAGPSTTTTAAPSTTTTAAPATTTTAAPATTTTAAPATTTTAAPQVLQQSASSATTSGSFSSDGNGGYGVSNSGGNNWDGPDDTSSKITFTFTVAVEGTYKIKGSVKAPNGNDDSFWVQVDGGPSDGFLWDVRNGSSYRDDYVAHRYGDDPVTVTLGPGEHTVTLSLRESGTYVQSLELVAV